MSWCALQNFSADISAMNADGAFSGKPCRELNTVVCEHLFRQGKMEVGEALMQVCVSVHSSPLVALSVDHTPHQRLQEAELKLEPSYLDQFAELNLVLEALRARNVEPALE